MAVCIAPRFCNAYNAIGNCLDELGRFGAAVKNYEKVLEINPFHAEAKLKLALVTKKIGWAGELKRDSSNVKIQENEKRTNKVVGLWKRTDFQICFHDSRTIEFLIFTFSGLKKKDAGLMQSNNACDP